MTCNQGHGEISYQRGKCPLCQSMEETGKLRRLLENAQFDLLVNEVEMLSNFSFDEENKVFSFVGQA